MFNAQAVQERFARVRAEFPHLTSVQLHARQTIDADSLTSNLSSPLSSCPSGPLAVHAFRCFIISIRRPHIRWSSYAQVYL